MKIEIGQCAFYAMTHDNIGRVVKSDGIERLKSLGDLQTVNFDCGCKNCQRKRMMKK